MEFDLTNLRRPAVLVAFSGWNDAGEAATSVLQSLLDRHESHVLAVIEGNYYDLRQSRPIVSIHDGTRTLEYPRTRVFLCRTPQRDLLLIAGEEPNFAWPAFCQQLIAHVQHADASPVVVLGSMNSDEPHTRPLPVAVDATNPDLVWGLGAEESDYTGPTGITGVFAHEAIAAGQQVVSMWVTTPFYAPEGECPTATLALARRVSEVLGIDFDFDDLETRSASWLAQLAELMDSDDDLAQYVHGLEEARDEGLSATSGEDLAAQIEQFLRNESQG